MKRHSILALMAALSLQLGAVSYCAAETLPADKPADASVASTTGVSSNSEYAVAMVAVSEVGWDAIRYDLNSGKTWKLAEGRWTEMKDTGVLPASRYKVEMVALAGAWGALRFDTRSGRSWRAADNGWTEVLEGPPPSPAE